MKVRDERTNSNTFSIFKNDTTDVFTGSKNKTAMKSRVSITFTAYSSSKKTNKLKSVMIIVTTETGSGNCSLYLHREGGNSLNDTLVVVQSNNKRMVGCILS